MSDEPGPFPTEGALATQLTWQVPAAGSSGAVVAPRTPRLEMLPVPLPPPNGRRWRQLRRKAPLVMAGIDGLALLTAEAVVRAAELPVALMAAVVGVLFLQGGLYRTRLTLSALDDTPALVGRLLAATGITTAVVGIVRADDPDKVYLLTAALFGVLLVVGRVVAYTLIRRVRSSGRVQHRTLIIGAGQLGGQLAKRLVEHPEYGLRPIGFVDSDPLLSESERSVPVLGETSALASVIRRSRARVVVVAFGSMRESKMVDILRTCDRLDCEIFFVPRLYEVHQTSESMDQVWGLPLVRLSRPAFRNLSWGLKRVFDVLLTTVVLLPLAPLLGVIALAVRFEGGPGVLFRQERIGLDGRSFWLLKFRSMKPVDENESATNWSIAQDDRVGPVGKVLRRTSLDELPQLWNVLRGDMTLVGPRPERSHFVAKFGATMPRYIDRHRVRVGLTGWAQVNGLRGDTSIEDRARFDNYYIENWSLWTDIKIILRTVTAVLRREGA